MSRRAKVSVVVLFGWTAFVWLTRIANAWNDAAMTSVGKAVTTAVSLALVALAAASVWSVFANRAIRVVQLFLVATVVVWVVRVPQILLDEHDAAFKIVHATLGIISVALAVVVWRAVRSEPLWDSPSPSSRSRAPQRASSASSSTAP